MSPGRYRVWSTWVEFPNRPANATYTVNGVPVTVDQRAAPSALVDAGRPWAALADATVSGTSLVVSLSNSPIVGEQTIADGVRIQRIGN